MGRWSPGWATVIIAMTAALMVPTASAVQSELPAEAPVWAMPRVLDGRIYAIESFGDTVVVAGTFTQIRHHLETDPVIDQPYIFSFDSSTGRIHEEWGPDLDDIVNGLAMSADGQHVFVGGAFTNVNGVAREGLVKLSLATGQIDPSWVATTNGPVEDIARTGTRLVAGGRFGWVNASHPRTRLASFDTSTGLPHADLDLPVTHPREFDTFVAELDISANGQWLVFSGNFNKVDGEPRGQLAVVEFTESGAELANWRTLGYAGNCSGQSATATWIRGLDIAPDSTWFVVNTTGSFAGGPPKLCDSVTRWELPPTASGSFVEPTWSNYSGGDTLWAVEVTEAAVIAGGHQRWMNNPAPQNNGRVRGDQDGPGAVPREGIAALDPVSGVPLSWNPGRSRGRGVEAIHANDDFLFVGSDTTIFNGVVRQRLAVLPTDPSYGPNVMPETLALPVDLMVARDDGSVDAIPFSGSTLGSATTVSGPDIDGIDWSSTRGAFRQHDEVMYYGAGGAYYERPLAGTTFGPATNLSATVGYVDNEALTPFDQPFGVDTTTAAAYSDGRIFYTRSDDTRLWSRWYSLESGIIGPREFVASAADWSDATAFTIAGGFLFATRDDGTLTSTFLDGFGTDDTSTTVIDDGSAGFDWASAVAVFSVPGDGPADPPDPPDPRECPAPFWRATYRIGLNVADAPVAIRCDLGINADWGFGGPDVPGNPVDDFWVIWETTFATSRTVELTYDVDVRGGAVRMYVGGELVLDEWTDKNTTATISTGPILIRDGGDVRVEFYDEFGNAAIDVTPIGLTLVEPPCPTDPPTPFDDISSSFATADITCLYNLGITNGITPTTFQPTLNVSREQMAAFLIRLMTSITGDTPPIVATPFTDIAQSFAADDIARLHGLGITSGTTSSTYSPNGPVTREQMAAFLSRMYTLLTGAPAPAVSTPFTDIGGSFAAADIARLYGLGITQGTTANLFSPIDVVSREQMAAFLARLYRSI